jgi:hypothetical protein
MRMPAVVLALLISLAPLAQLAAQVRLIVGPTPIPQAAAGAAGDITVVNDKLAFALAIDSTVPYGVPRGALVAIAPVSRGRILRNRVVFADFIPDNWSAWPNTYHRVEILERGPQQVRIRMVRDFGEATVTTLYTLVRGSDQVAIRTTLTNVGKRRLANLLAGLTLWPNSGFRFALPGLAGVTEGKAAGALSKRVVAYDADWTVTLHAPYLDHIGSGSRDLFRLTTLQPGESQAFDGWLQVGARGDLAPVVAAEIARDHLPAGTVSGSVTTGNGAALAAPVVVAEKAGVPYAWVLGRGGRYQLPLPVGDYTLYATGKNYARSSAVAVKVVAGERQVRDFHDLAAPGSVQLQVSDAGSAAPLDARLTIVKGDKPVVEFLGRTTFFTALEHKGRAQFPLAPGAYVLAVASGAGFLAPPTPVSLNVVPDKLTTAAVLITRLFDPPARGWYAADLHHHADQAEAVTPPPDLARSQLAAGLDVLFVSDHDATVNHAALRAIAAQRGIPFIAGIELSPSWGHFNAYPITPGMQLAVDTSTANVDAIFREARREGASVVQVNHPFIPYGYFASLDAGVAPGGFNPGFDLIEINSTVPGDDAKVLQKIAGFWSAGQRYYLSAGSDTHDVWNDESGRVRMFVHVDGPLSATAFVAALKAGHAYVSYGPLMYPSIDFGTQVEVHGKPVALGLDLAAVAGLKEVRLVSAAGVRSRQVFADAARQVHVNFELTPESGGWYAVQAEDQKGHQAYSDPVWVTSAPVRPAAASAAH